MLTRASCLWCHWQVAALTMELQVCTSLGDGGGSDEGLAKRLSELEQEKASLIADKKVSTVVPLKYL